MPFQIIRNDITEMRVDAIVNTANPRPLIGFGVDSGIHRKAGPQLLAARKRIGKLSAGQAAVTPGFDLPAKYVIHTCAPVWYGGQQQEAVLLYRCYAESLALARKTGCHSIAFPLIASGNNGFPKPLALQIAMDAIQAFLRENEMDVCLVVFDRDSFQLSENLARGIRSFIDDQTAIQKDLEEHCGYGMDPARRSVRTEADFPRTYIESNRAPAPPQSAAPAKKKGISLPSPRISRQKKEMPKALPSDGFAPDDRQAPPQSPVFTFPATMPVAPASLQDMLRQEDKGFSETLLDLIDRTGKKDSEIYTKANVSRQHFSKIRNNPAYKPTKATAIAFAIALELDMEETRDLIGRAGYALTRSSKFDLIIMYFIQTRNYNMFDINAALFEFDQVLLGA